MTHYRVNLRDIEFNLFELFGAQNRMGSDPFPDIDPETARTVLKEVARVASGPLAESFTDADRHPPVYDPAARTVTMPDSFRRSFDALFDSDWWRVNLPADLGGLGASPSLQWAVNEMLLGSNPCVVNTVSGASTNVVVLNLVGNAEQRRWAELMVEHRWGGAVALTEPDAGSDVGAGRTKAIDNGDGTWRIEGVKRFITSGEMDTFDNIVHLVLARPEGAKPGTKGLSMFLVPKFHVDLRTGELGERNGVYATNLEKKMGLKSSPTCEITYGGDEPAVGWLIGDVHEGIAQIFNVMEYARMSVGTKAIAALSTGYLHALEYARNRVQGSDLVDLADKSAPRVTIIHHPDVRRSLLQLKSYSEGLRSLVQYAAQWQELVAVGAADGRDVSLARRMNDLLLPVIKGVGGDRSYEMLAIALQTFGGSGYMQDYPIEQYIRDTKIDSIYEGTTAIQAMDLFFRKMVTDNFVAFDHLTADIAATTGAEAVDGLTRERGILGSALEDVRALADLHRDWATAATVEPSEIYKVGLNAQRLLMAVGELILGWLLLRQAEIAAAALASGTSDTAFYEGKVESARWFVHNRLPLLAAERTIAEATNLAVMRLPEAAF